jgi:hypothetical protein
MSIRIFILCFITTFIFNRCENIASDLSSIRIMDSLNQARLDSLSKIQKNETPNPIQNCDYGTATSSLGIGMVLPPDKIEIYNDSLLKDNYFVWQVSKDYNPPKPACTLYYKPDYGFVHFVCLDTSATYFKVLINYDEIKYLPRSGDYTFESWEEYVFNSFGGIKRRSDKKTSYQPLRKSPEDNADTITIKNSDATFCPMEMRGDWINVKYDCYQNIEDVPGEPRHCQEHIGKCGNTSTGWIRWKKGNQILIEIYLML